jgi:hypothetical protein
MSKCIFSIEFTESPNSLIEKANKAITEAGGTFSGDASSGSFSLKTPIGSVAGSYTIDDLGIAIQISDKPVFVSCNKIESELRKYLKS